MTTALSERPTTHFALPEATTAATTPEERGLRRDQVRLLVGSPDGVVDARFVDLPGHLRAGDLVVVNNSATAAAQADAELVGRGPVVVHVAARLDDGSRVIEVRAAPDAARAVLDAAPGDEVLVGPVRLRLVEAYPHRSSPTGQGNRLWRVAVDGDLSGWLWSHGRPIAYGYLSRQLPLSAYQSIFGIVPGSAEMPSAGRPFSAEVVTGLVSRGVGLAPITLHTGVSSQEAGEGPQPEWFQVPGATADLVNRTRARGGRVVAVGTTVTRALESAVAGDGAVQAGSGWTERVVTPRQPPRVVDGLITGWHDPMASHLLLVEAVAGPELTQRAYDAAVGLGYLWHEFGDSALLLP